jgi:hypothetical protein
MDKVLQIELKKKFKKTEELQYLPILLTILQIMEL